MTQPPSARVPEKPTIDGIESVWAAGWEGQGTYRFAVSRPRAEVYSIDTPPPTVSGSLHVGHVFSYTHTDLVARYKRMRGFDVFYPMGWDDNGLPTERRVQNYFGVRCEPTLPCDPAFQPPAKPDPKRQVPISRRNFIELCEQLTLEDEKAFEALFRQLGLSVDWRQTYQTIDANARAASQKAFLRNLARGEAYHHEAPTLWDVTFRTAVAQAELEDREMPGAYHRVAFPYSDGSGVVHIETTRPELLAACVALVAHPDDARYQEHFGRTVTTPVFGVEVPVRARWVRAVLAEHTRTASHLAHLSFVGHRLRDAALDTTGVREELRERTAELTGNRLHPMAVRLGGVACDPTPVWADAERATLARASELAARLGAALGGGLGAGVAAVTRAQVDAHGLAGPVARASGVATDLRRHPDRPGGHEAPWADLADLLDLDTPTTGDAHARFSHLAAEVTASAAMVDRLLDGLPDGPLRAHLPKVVKLPEGDWLAAVEAPLGRAGMVVTSRGEKTPWRLRLRTPSFANVSAWPAVLPGTAVADLDIALVSLPWVAGDLDK